MGGVGIRQDLQDLRDYLPHLFILRIMSNTLLCRLDLRIAFTVRAMDDASRAQRFRDSRLIRIGVALFVLGSGPLLAVIVAAELGLTCDPNPNPVGFGILAMCSFWPSVILIVWGIVGVVRKRRSAGE